MPEAIMLTVESVRTRASTQEALVTFAVPIEQAALISSFMGKIGKSVGAAFADLEKLERQKEQPTKEPNTLAQEMHRNGYFRNPKLWAAMEAAKIYTQAEHKKHIESLLCCWPDIAIRESGRASPVLPCEGDIVAHHCNSAALPAAGTGSNPRKPPHWYTVPLCAITHHQNGIHGPYAGRNDKALLLTYAVELTAQQVKKKIKEYLGIESLSEITQEMLDNFEKEMGL